MCTRFQGLVLHSNSNFNQKSKWNFRWFVLNIDNLCKEKRAHCKYEVKCIYQDCFEVKRSSENWFFVGSLTSLRPTIFKKPIFQLSAWWFNNLGRCIQPHTCNVHHSSLPIFVYYYPSSWKTTQTSTLFLKDLFHENIHMKYWDCACINFV